MIPQMAIEIDGIEYLTTAEAAELAREIGKPVSKQGITGAARNGRIEGATKLGDGNISWLLPRAAFVAWLKARVPRGPKKSWG